MKPFLHTPYARAWVNIFADGECSVIIDGKRARFTGIKGLVSFGNRPTFTRWDLTDGGLLATM